MIVTTGNVTHGVIELEPTILTEGAKVTILALEDDDTFELDATDEANLLAAIAEAERGETHSAAEVLAGIRSR